MWQWQPSGQCFCSTVSTPISFIPARLYVCRKLSFSMVTDRHTIIPFCSGYFPFWILASSLCLFLSKEKRLFLSLGALQSDTRISSKRSKSTLLPFLASVTHLRNFTVLLWSVFWGRKREQNCVSIVYIQPCGKFPDAGTLRIWPLQSAGL